MYLSSSLSVCACMSVSQTGGQSDSLSVASLFICLPVYQSDSRQAVSQPVCLNACLSIYNEDSTVLFSPSNIFRAQCQPDCKAGSKIRQSYRFILYSNFQKFKFSNQWLFNEREWELRTWLFVTFSLCKWLECIVLLSYILTWKFCLCQNKTKQW